MQKVTIKKKQHRESSKKEKDVKKEQKKERIRRIEKMEDKEIIEIDFLIGCVCRNCYCCIDHFKMNEV
uniref:Uncharacterized protein n=1 Tax=Romanomermis culicivorax TaxID=13658 RepID=A0A915KNE4_ROMCU